MDQSLLALEFTETWREAHNLPGTVCCLPNELLIQMFELLEASDRGCLALCDRTLHAKLFKAATKAAFLHNNLQREALIAKDDPSLFYCHYCHILQETARVPPPHLTGLGKFKDSLHCVVQRSFQRQLHVPLQIHRRASTYQFGFQHVRLVMARHRLSPSYGMDADALSVVEVMVHLTSERRTTTLLSVKPRIVNDDLHLRIQQWIMFDSDDLSSAVGSMAISVCAHCNAGFCSRHLMVDLITCKLQHANSHKDCPTCHPFLRCRYCGIEAHIGVRRLQKDRGRVIMISKWLSLGEGDTPHQNRWKRHLYNPAQYSPDSQLLPADAENGTRTGLKARHAKSYHALTDEMARLLETDSYMRDFARLQGTICGRVEPSLLNILTRAA